MKVRLLLFFIFIKNTLSLADFSLNFENAIKSLADNYKREFTVLELCYNYPDFSYKYNNIYNATFVLLPYLSASREPVFNNLIKKSFNNLVLLNPKVIDLKMLNILGRCESPDIVIVHSISELDFLNNMYKALINIGDFLCIQDSEDSIKKIIDLKDQKNIYASSLNNSDSFCIIKTEKKGLDIARWNLAQERHLEEPRYLIKSDFNIKMLYKKDVAAGLPYIKGFNLLTCIMLYAFYPTDKIIRDNISLFKDLDHNDLVLGNFIVQGRSIVPIDFNDNRYKGDARRCVNAALKFFKKNRRFKDLDYALKSYDKKVQKC